MVKQVAAGDGVLFVLLEEAVAEGHAPCEVGDKLLDGDVVINNIPPIHLDIIDSAKDDTVIDHYSYLLNKALIAQDIRLGILHVEPPDQEDNEGYFEEKQY